MSKTTSPERVKTYYLRLTPLQYPIMRDLILHNVRIGLNRLETINNGPVRSLHRRELLTVNGPASDPYLVATPAGERAFKLYHRGTIARRIAANDITDYVRVMLRLKKRRAA
jgi:hypothetical protein